MSDDSLRVLSSPALVALDSLAASANVAIEQTIDDPAAASSLGKIAVMTAYVRDTLRAADPILVTDTLLTLVNNNVQQAISALAGFAAGDGSGNLQTAIGGLDQAMVDATRVAPSLSPRAMDRSREALVLYHRVIDQLTESARTRLRELEHRADSLASSVQQVEMRLSGLENRGESSLASQQQNFDALQAQRQSAFDTAQAQRQETFETDLSNKRAEGMRLLHEFGDASDQALNAVGQSFTAKKTELDEVIETGRLMVQEAADSFRADNSQRAEAIMAALEVRRGEADKLVGLIGERGVTSTYQRTANEARKEMIVWQVLTVAIMVGLLLGAIFEFVPALKGGWNWGIGGARIMVSIVAILSASYTGTQAKIARDAARKNRRREMDLSALGPYLADLPEDAKHELRTRIADRYFVDEVVPEHPASPLERLVEDPEIAAAIKGVPKEIVLAALKAAKTAL